MPQIAEFSQMTQTCAGDLQVFEVQYRQVSFAEVAIDDSISYIHTIEETVRINQYYTEGFWIIEFLIENWNAF